MKYPLPMRILHWTMSIIILCMLAVGIYMAGLADDAPNKYDWYFWHKSFGMLILGLVFLRILVRSRSNVPPAAPGLTHFEERAAVLSHKTLYALMILIPLCGYIMSAAYTKGSGVSFFGWFTFPDVVPKNDDWSSLARTLHKVFAFTLIGVLVIHLCAVLKHRFFDKKDVLKRML
jgi:cytochrome b561